MPSRTCVRREPHLQLGLKKVFSSVNKHAMCIGTVGVLAQHVKVEPDLGHLSGNRKPCMQEYIQLKQHEPGGEASQTTETYLHYMTTPQHGEAIIPLSPVAQQTQVRGALAIGRRL